MAFIVDGSVQGFGPQLDLFDKLETETGILDRYYKEVKPSGLLTANTPLEFHIPNDSPDFIDVSKIKLKLEYDILNDQGQPLEEWDKCGPINNPISSFFNQMDFMLDQKNITLSVGANYHYKAMFDILLNKGEEYRTSFLTMGGFVKDTSNYMDDYTCTNNLGLMKRREMTTDKHTAQLLSYLYCDFAYQNKFLLNSVPIALKFHPVGDKFRLMWPTPPKPKPVNQDQDPEEFDFKGASKKKPSEYFNVRFKDASIFVSMIKINPSYLTQTAETLKEKPVVYEPERSDIKAFSVPKGNFEFVGENIFNDLIPKKLIIAMVTAKSYSGDNQSNPLNFQHFDAKEVNFQVNGQNVNTPIRVDFGENHFFPGYATIFEGMTENQREVPDISPDEFQKGYTLFQFDLAKTKEPNIKNILAKGSTRLTIRYATGLPEAIVVICYGLFDSVITVDLPRNVTLYNG